MRATLAEVVCRGSITHLVATPTVLATLDADSLADAPDRGVGRRTPAVRVGGDLGAASTALQCLRSHGIHNPGVGRRTAHAGRRQRVDIGTRGRHAAFVLDSSLHPVPDGVTGELYLSGSSVARGYLGPRWSHSRTVRPQPYGKPGDRMYRTGDIVRRNPNGELEYLGRNDSQVKMHGIRVEPAEVDAVLRGTPDVRFVITTPVSHPADDRPRLLRRGRRRSDAQVVANSPRGRCPDIWCRPPSVVDACRFCRPAKSTDPHFRGRRSIRPNPGMPAGELGDGGVRRGDGRRRRPRRPRFLHAGRHLDGRGHGGDRTAHEAGPRRAPPMALHRSHRARLAKRIEDGA